MIDKGMLYRKSFQGGGADMGQEPDSKGNVGPGPGGGNDNKGKGRDLDFQQRGRPKSYTTTKTGDVFAKGDPTLTEKTDVFGQKFTGSFLDNIFGGGYRNVNPQGQFQSRFSQLGGFGKGILGSVLGYALGLPSLITAVPSGIQTLQSNFTNSKLGNYLSNLNQKLQKDFSIKGTYVPNEDEDEDEVITQDIRDKYNRLGIMNPNLITPTNLNDLLGYRNREYIENVPSNNLDFDEESMYP
jgi:hypothetical protein